MSAHSAIVGGSTCGRLLECPGSFQATLALPLSIETPSVYAEEGTAMHAVMEQLMLQRQAQRRIDSASSALALVGSSFNNIVLTREHVDSMILPALTALAELEAEHGNGFQVIAVEKQVRFPGVPGAFGTIDLILASATHILHVDWKFGQGVGVKAVTIDAAGAKVNPQLLFYITAAKTVMPTIYTGMRLVGAIIQPRGMEPLTRAEISRQELKYFRQDVEAAVVKALQPDPVRVKGEHCRFAPCKSTCPLWTGPLLDLTAISLNPHRPQAVAADHADAEDYGRYLADAKRLVDQFAIFKKEIDDQMKAFLDGGGSIPGWRLKLKAKQRVWADPNMVVPALVELGFEEDELFQPPKLITFQAADAIARKLGVSIPDELRPTPPTHETTIATTDDPAPVVDRSKTVELFRASLQQLISQEQ